MSLKIKKANICISVIIPIYNGGNYIAQCLDSLLKQSYPDWEAVCIDDGSTDSTPDILREYAKSDDRIKVYTQENQGVVKARDLGIKHAIGKYVFFLDVDDTLSFSTLEMIVNKIKVKNNPDIIHFSINIVDKGNVKTKHPNFSEINKLDYLKRILTGKNGWELCGKCYHRELFFKSSLELPNIRVGEDAVVFIQLVCRSDKIVSCFEGEYNYIQYPESVSHSVSPELALETIQAAVMIEKYLKINNYGTLLKDEISSMYLLFYSRSTRRAILPRNHSMIKQIRKEHLRWNALKNISHIKAMYIVATFTFLRNFLKI